MNIRNNRGITLIALIITVIVLTILAVVSVGVIIDNDFFNKAQDTVGKASSGLENQKQQEAQADEEWENVPGKTVKSGTKVESGIEFSVTTSEITRTSFKISAEGTNKYEEALTYVLIMTDKDWNENAIQEYNEPKETTVANESVYWDLTGLTPNTTYYFKVIATDGRAENNQVSIKSKETTLLNNAPIITANKYVDEQATTEFKIEMQAKDSDKDNLIYELLVLENGEYYSVWSSTVASETTETITVNSINGKAVKEYTQYNWKFRVTDIFGVSDEETDDLRTYCPGTGNCPIVEYCSEVSYSSVKCTNCDENGKIPCDGVFQAKSWKTFVNITSGDSDVGVQDECAVCGQEQPSGTKSYIIQCDTNSHTLNWPTSGLGCYSCAVEHDNVGTSCTYKITCDETNCENGYIQTANKKCPTHSSCRVNHYWCSEHNCVSTVNGHDIGCSHNYTQPHND